MRPSISDVELQGLISAFFTVSKRRWAWSLALETAAVAIGAASVIFGFTALWVGIGVTIIATVASLARWWSDSLRADAEALHRQNEFLDGLGWEPDARLIADLKEDHPGLASLAVKRQKEQADWYDSDLPNGPKRILEMLRESAWWTVRLSRFTSRVVVWGGGTLVLASLYGLLISWLATTSEPEPAALASLLTSAISLVFSLDIARLLVEYRILSNEADAAFGAAEGLVDTTEVSESQALRPVLRYQVARGLAPPLPDWVWRLRKDNLNQLWAAHLSRRANAPHEEEPGTSH